MVSVTIDDRSDRSYPFDRSLFENPTVLYHGTWSTWSPTVERDGFVRGCAPFDWNHVATIYEANRRIGRGSSLKMFLGKSYPRTAPPVDLYFAAVFWFARAYACDGGGEAVRLALEEADKLESICARPDLAADLRKHWERGLREREDGPTRAAVEVLSSPESLAEIAEDVRTASRALRRVTQGGHPVVYAVHVEPEWFGDHWADHLRWRDMGMSDVNMRSRCETIDPGRIVARVSYPNGTERDFLPTWCSRWEDVIGLHTADV